MHGGELSIVIHVLNFKNPFKYSETCILLLVTRLFSNYSNFFSQPLMLKVFLFFLEHDIPKTINLLSEAVIHQRIIPVHAALFIKCTLGTLKKYF